MSIYTIAPATWTNDLPVPNANTFNKEIHDRLTDIDTNVADKTTAQTLTNKTLTSPVITNKSSTGTDSGAETLTNKTLTSPKIDDIVAATVNNITLTPGANKLVKTAVLRQNIAANVYINNTVILTGWKFASLPNILNYQAIGVTFDITFSEIPIVTITPISKRVGLDPTTLTELCESNHAALETAKVRSISTTGFTGELWSTVAYSAGDRVGFMWTAIGQLN